MATQIPPKRGVAFYFETGLVSQADTDVFQTNPTLAAGDVVVYKDGVLDGNIDTLPVAIGAGKLLLVTLSIAEMTADRVTVVFSDALGGQWQDQIVTVHTSTNQIDDLATATALATVDGNVDAILLDTGTDGVVLANDAITAAKIAADAITSSELALSAIQEIADGVLSRGVANTEATADTHSLTEMILAAFESNLAGILWTIYQTDHATVFNTRTVGLNAAALPIIGVD